MSRIVVSDPLQQSGIDELRKASRIAVSVHAGMVLDAQILHPRALERLEPGIPDVKRK